MALTTVKKKYWFEIEVESLERIINELPDGLNNSLDELLHELDERESQGVLEYSVKEINPLQTNDT